MIRPLQPERCAQHVVLSGQIASMQYKNVTFILMECVWIAWRGRENLNPASAVDGT